jgi:hypothetical protein
MHICIYLKIRYITLCIKCVGCRIMFCKKLLVLQKNLPLSSCNLYDKEVKMITYLYAELSIHRSSLNYCVHENVGSSFGLN